jgi:hypothetical protein
MSLQINSNIVNFFPYSWKNILHLNENAEHFPFRCSYTERNRKALFANLFRFGIKNSFNF